MRKLFCWAICSATLLGQATDLKIAAVDAAIKGEVKVADVFFSQALDTAHSEDLAPAGVVVRSLPSGKAMSVAGVRRLGGDPTELEIWLTGQVPAGDVQLMIEFKNPLHAGSGAASKGPLTYTATLVKDAKTLADAMQKLAAAMTATAQPAAEKNVFASGFVTTASGGLTQAAGNVHLNSPDLGIAGLKTFANLQASTVAGASGETVDAGVSYRFTHLLGKSGRDRIQSAMTAFNKAGSAAERSQAAVAYDTAMTAFQQTTLAAALFDVDLKVEGDPLSLSVTNLVYDSSFKLQSRVKKIANGGYYAFQLVPAGAEMGRTLGAKAGRYLGIERLKSGATFTAGLKRLELELAAVDRYSFMNEATVRAGNRPYGQADLKLFVYENASARYGVGVSYQRGSLPPLYAPVKSFQVGFLVESAH